MHHGVGQIQDFLAAPVIPDQGHGFCPPQLFREIQNILDVSAPEPIDALAVIPDYAQLLCVSPQQEYDLRLQVVGVLVFIDHDVVVPFIEELPDRFVLLQQVTEFDQQVVKVQKGAFFLVRPEILNQLCDLMPVLLCVTSLRFHHPIQRHIPVDGLGKQRDHLPPVREFLHLLKPAFGGQHVHGRGGIARRQNRVVGRQRRFFRKPPQHVGAE